MALEFPNRLSKVQLCTFLTTAAAELLLFVAVITPSWQVADDTDMGRTVASGLWLYCPGGGLQCWYIFNDDVVNQYERADVCRFLLIGDCRKKLLRTPYFFSWHYAVLTIMLVVLALGMVSIGALAFGYFQPRRVLKITTVIFDSVHAFSILMLCIGLAVFIANAEMLESRYLIGVKHKFEKNYGYSFYLACLSLLTSLFTAMIGIFLTTLVFFMPLPAQFANANDDEYIDDFRQQQYADEDQQKGGFGAAAETSFDPVLLMDGSYQYREPGSRQEQFKTLMQNPARQTPTPIEQFGDADAPRYCHSPSIASSSAVRTHGQPISYYQRQQNYR